jgi:hypothetical protein
LADIPCFDRQVVQEVNVEPGHQFEQHLVDTVGAGLA